MSKHAQHWYTETDTPKWNAAIIKGNSVFLLFYFYLFNSTMFYFSLSNLFIHLFTVKTQIQFISYVSTYVCVVQATFATTSITHLRPNLWPNCWQSSCIVGYVSVCIISQSFKLSFCVWQYYISAMLNVWSCLLLLWFTPFSPAVTCQNVWAMSPCVAYKIKHILYSYITHIVLSFLSL